MKKIKVFICFILCISMVLSLSSCNIYRSDIYNSMFNRTARPKGYTGGFMREPHFYRYLEIHWLETFEEAMNAIEHLEAAGNKIPLTVISSYENESIDAKYCFLFRTYGSKRLKKGEEWYDRKVVNGISITYYGFLDKMTVSELEHYYLECCKTVTVGCSRATEEKLDPSAELSCVCKSYEFQPGLQRNYCDIVEKGTSRCFASIGYNLIEDHWSELPADFHEEFPKTIVYIGE